MYKKLAGLIITLCAVFVFTPTSVQACEACSLSKQTPPSDIGLISDVSIIRSSGEFIDAVTAELFRCSPVYPLATSEDIGLISDVIFMNYPNEEDVSITDLVRFKTMWFNMARVRTYRLPLGMSPNTAPMSSSHVYNCCFFYGTLFFESSSWQSDGAFVIWEIWRSGILNHVACPM